MEFKRSNTNYFLRLDPDEKIMETLMAFLEENFIPSAILMGVGAVKEVTLRYFNQENKTFVQNTFSEPMEVTALTGNITSMDGTAYIHPHIVLGRKDFTTISGHLHEGIVGPTLELAIIGTEMPVERIFSPQIGLNILKFD